MLKVSICHLTLIPGLSSVEIFLDKFEGTAVGVELMKEIVTFAKGSLDITKPMMFFIIICLFLSITNAKENKY